MLRKESLSSDLKAAGVCFYTRIDSTHLELDKEEMDRCWAGTPKCGAYNVIQNSSGKRVDLSIEEARIFGPDGKWSTYVIGGPPSGLDALQLEASDKIQHNSHSRPAA